MAHTCDLSTPKRLKAMTWRSDSVVKSADCSQVHFPYPTAAYKHLERIQVFLLDAHGTCARSQNTDVETRRPSWATQQIPDQPWVHKNTVSKTKTIDT